MATNRNQYKTEFAKSHYDNISLKVPKGCKAKMQLAATLNGFRSVSAFIVDAVEKQYHLDLSKSPDTK